MKKGFPVYFLLFCIILVQHTAIMAQNRESLQENKRKLEEEIRVANVMLEKTSKDKAASLAHISILDNKIQSREALIRNLNAEVGILDHKIAVLSDSVDYYRQHLQTLRKEYEKMVIHAWETRNLYHRLMFIFAADDFNQAYRRLQYYGRYSEARREQAKRISRIQQEFEAARVALEQQKKQQLALLYRKESEKSALDGERNQRQSTVTQLQQKEKDLRAQIRKKQQAAKKLEQEIERIIREEMAKANQGKRASSFSLTPEESLLSNDFSRNKGKLPWPTARGILHSTYGEHAHPVLKGVKIKNNGMDILTEEGALARAIFQGTVSRIIKVPQYNNVVIIRHGEFLSVYSNLDKVFVVEGSNVDARTEIGTIFTDTETGQTQIHLEIWKGSTLENPQLWLAR
ncbi:MAG: hypothetical protein EOL88_01615 [Bacteroidia bacterium]|nr:hypothetical protein [Bacteroidia bacterium]